MASSKRFLGLLFVMFVEFLSSSQAYKFNVGGKDGWILIPSVNFNRWAERNRFQVNDTLFFKYKKGSDSVLVVTKDDYFSCNTKNPIMSLTDGESIFKLDRSGPFFFVSGDEDSCRKGQKLIVVVLAVRHKPHPPPEAGGGTTPASPPLAKPPSGLSPRAESPEPSASPTKNSGAPAGFSVSVWLVLCASVGASVVFG
ncbi:hypothetical protein FNV43_RR13788 [Rhamnella rubrinervis]|uniref:Phytocyanin domain-containing protein n=1 Tax=Rhamnella rubrinervis TaxID=2594499 RepID=A0A8K0MFS1_9ROSA|nr:hypothetical protein FNV43_RR13788 [Rhamnella rubrinervis]